MAARVRAPSKIPGGKKYMIPYQAKYWPNRKDYMTFIEAYGGQANALLYHNGTLRGEIYNELSPIQSTFWRVIQSKAMFDDFWRRVATTQFSEVEFDAAWNRIDAHRNTPYLDDMETAINFYILSRFSRSGDLVSFAPRTKNRLRADMQEQVSAWLGIIPVLPEIHARCMRWLVMCRPAIDVIEEFNNEKIFMYLDPPYHPDTRTSPDAYGEFDMTVEDHEKLCKVLNDSKAKIMLAGYDNPLYRKELSHWYKIIFPGVNHLSCVTGEGEDRKKKYVEECVWINYTPPITLPPNGIHPTTTGKQLAKDEKARFDKERADIVKELADREQAIKDRKLAKKNKASEASDDEPDEE